jgi:hypothetical protein
MLAEGREAAEWLGRSADRYRESFAEAPPGSWGRPIGAIKARVLARDWDGARADSAWTLEQGAAASGSAIGTYAGVLATLVLEDDATAARLAASLLGERDDAFPRPVAAALAALAAADATAYERAVRAVLESFEEREAHLEDVPVADTVIVLEALAERRGLGVGLTSPLLPSGS